MIHKQDIIIWYPLKKVMDFFSGSKCGAKFSPNSEGGEIPKRNTQLVNRWYTSSDNIYLAPLSLVYSQWITSARTFVSNSLWTCVERNPECTTLNVEHSSVTSRDKTTNLTWWRPDFWTKSQQFCWFPSGRHSIGKVYQKNDHESHHSDWFTAGCSILGFSTRWAPDPVTSGVMGPLYMAFNAWVTGAIISPYL